MKRVIYLLLSIFLLTGCESVWTSFFYPTGVSGEVIIEESFSNKEACLDWCYHMHDIYVNQGYSSLKIDYECGKNCKLEDASLPLYICKETVDG